MKSEFVHVAFILRAGATMQLLFYVKKRVKIHIVRWNMNATVNEKHWREHALILCGAEKKYGHMKLT